MNSYKEDLRSHYQYEGEIHAKEGEGISIIEGEEREGARVHQGTIEEGIH